MIVTIARRSFDLAIAAILLILASPLFVIVAILIKCDSQGPVYFRQRRVGLKGREFRIWKFRTMVVNAVSQGAGLATFKGDPRVTRVGGWLRKYRLDELPQLLNVLLAEMSLVGPRPLLPDFLHAYSARDRRRLLVKPGMTGWQQVKGGSRNTWDERITLDLWYVENRSFWVDVKILILTVAVVLRADSVFGEDGWQRSGGPSGAMTDTFKE